MLTKVALWWLSRAMRKDIDYAWSWHCNIAMVAQDAGAPWEEANKRTSDFMKRAFGVDTTLMVDSLIYHRKYKDSVGAE